MQVIILLVKILVFVSHIQRSNGRSNRDIIYDYLPVFDKTHNAVEKIISNTTIRGQMINKIMMKTLYDHQNKYKKRLKENLNWIQYEFNYAMMEIGMASNNSFQMLKCNKYSYDFLFYITISYEGAENACFTTAQKQIDKHNNNVNIFAEKQKMEHQSIDNVKIICNNEYTWQLMEECLIEKLYVYYKAKINQIRDESNNIINSITYTAKPISENLTECSEIASRKYKDSLRELLEMLVECFGGKEFMLPFQLK